MTTHHLVRRAADLTWSPPVGPLADSAGLEQWSVVDASTPAVHTGFGLARLAPGGRVPSHVHSYEESVYVTDGQLVVQTPGEAVRLGPGGYGLIPIGVPHSLRNEDDAETRFVRVSVPVPRPEHDHDTQRVPDVGETAAVDADVRDPRTRRYGRITEAHMDARQQSQELLDVSASMRTALLVYSGITLKMMVDSDLGAVLSSMFMVQYEPHGAAGLHDHPLEETYLILDGTVEATFDGEVYQLEPGDVAWAGVGCQHSFRNGDGVVRWLETQAPPLPPRHGYRFARDWDYLRSRLEGDAR
ncbi:cupin domain-containing protein [Nocardioides sp. GXQ0305]|uniref:cupin domain-containing protein n=1 Tax=Nocardioides sp. GXQ0305 TaxID=3423912 RepID=UPI003D7CBEDC